uniref:WDR19 WD40 repeat domain-containing protein n=1 Tax=Ditylenchus dipsaci TaxID=166011 RepID=A0A915E0N9_9BILA
MFRLKIRELHELNEISDLVDVDSEDKGLVQVSASEDGSLTAVSGKSGSFSIYLTTLPIMAAAYQSCIGVLSSLTEVTLYKDGDMQPCLTMNVKIEPSLLAVGPEHVAVVLNNRAWFYEIRKNTYNLVYEHEYLTTVSKLRLNREYVMAKLDGKVHLHKIPPAQQREEGEGEGMVEWMDSRIFPDNNELSVEQQHAANQSPMNQGICDAELSEKFFIYATKNKYIYYFSLAHQSTVSDYKHTCQTKSIFVENQGIRICFIDERHDAYVYSVDDCLSKIPQIGTLLHYKNCLWETFTIDRDSFVIHDGSSIYVGRADVKPHQHSGHSLWQYTFAQMLSKGIVYCHTHNGRVNTILLKSHKTDTVFEGKQHTELKEMLIGSLTLKRWRNAWRICDHLKDKESWQLFSKAALEDMNIDLAIRIFRFIGDVGMVWRLEELLYTEEALTLAGHVTALLGTDFDSADDLFCRSKEPRNALDMRRDIQHWDRALNLAKQAAPEELPLISKEYAMQLEFYREEGDGKPVTPGFSSLEDEEEHNWVCKGGIARMALRTGDLRRGVQTALETPGRIAKRDCGLILEQMKQFDEAGRLYEAGLFYDRAVASFLRSKNWIKVNELIGQVRSPKILSQYGKILTSEKKYDKAFEVYSKARDYDHMISLLLKHLNRPEEAVRLAQESRSIEGAKMVAKFFTELGNNESAIEFLVLSQCYQEAYELAESCDRMNVYANSLESSVVTTTTAAHSTSSNHSQLFAQLADYYTLQRPSLLMAGRFAGLAKNFSMALDNLMQVNSSGRLNNTNFTIEEEDTAARLAVEFAAESEDRNLVYRLIDYLLGETDGIPKNPKYLFQFYVKLKMYPEAAKTAIIIAQDQQSKGFYKTAHDLLLVVVDIEKIITRK